MAIEKQGSTIVFIPEFNHLDTLNAQQFSDSFTIQVAENTCCIMDMSGVQFVDSSGLGAILNLVREIHQGNGRVAVAAAQPTVQVLFKMVKLSKLLPIFSTLEEAHAWAEE